MDNLRAWLKSGSVFSELVKVILFLIPICGGIYVVRWHYDDFMAWQREYFRVRAVSAARDRAYENNMKVIDAARKELVNEAVKYCHEYETGDRMKFLECLGKSGLDVKD